MKHRLLISGLLGVVALLGTAVVASAHGENAQEGFLRMETVTFSNVVFSKDTIKQGEDVTITGKATLLDTWPTPLGEPRRNLRQEGQRLRLQADPDGPRARALARASHLRRRRCGDPDWPRPVDY